MVSHLISLRSEGTDSNAGLLFVCRCDNVVSVCFRLSLLPYRDGQVQLPVLLQEEASFRTCSVFYIRDIGGSDRDLFLQADVAWTFKARLRIGFYRPKHESAFFGLGTGLELRTQKRTMSTLLRS
jgi:hypothetical protein